MHFAMYTYLLAQLWRENEALAFPDGHGARGALCGHITHNCGLEKHKHVRLPKEHAVHPGALASMFTRASAWLASACV